MRCSLQRKEWVKIGNYGIWTSAIWWRAACKGCEWAAKKASGLRHTSPYGSSWWWASSCPSLLLRLPIFTEGHYSLSKQKCASLISFGGSVYLEFMKSISWMLTESLVKTSCNDMGTLSLSFRKFYFSCEYGDFIICNVVIHAGLPTVRQNNSQAIIIAHKKTIQRMGKGSFIHQECT